MRWILTAGLFYVGLLELVTSPLLLCAAGCTVDYYLWAGALCVPALGWARKPFIKICAAVLVLISMRMAYTDHVRGYAYQEKVLRVKFMAEAKYAASTRPSTAPAGGEPLRASPQSNQ